jgi:hypothetical protein
MKNLDFVAVELKSTHHVLGVLSRDADAAGGTDLALLAPAGLTVRENRKIAADIVPANPPAELQVPVSQLQAVPVKNPNSAKRRQVFGDPLNCLVSDDGTVGPVAAGSIVPVLTLKPSGSVVPAFKIDLFGAVNADTPFTVVLQEADPAPDKPPFVCITEGKVLAGQPFADNVMITLMPGTNPALSPIPKGKRVNVLVAAAGYPLSLKLDPNP